MKKSKQIPLSRALGFKARAFLTAKKAARAAALFAVFWTLGTSLCSCGNSGQKTASLKIVNWNVQTFFDANNDGIEYSNFVKSKKWNQDAYKERLQKLCKAINELDADLLVLEEIENQGVVYDISNALAGNNWNPAKVYRYSCFAKKKDSSIGCALLSRQELKGMKVHSLDIQAEREKAPQMRPLIEVDLLAPKPLKIFVNHWKSKGGSSVGAKAGGARRSDTALWRRWQEGLLAKKIIDAQSANPKTAIVCAGDFNQDISEFSIASAAPLFGLEEDSWQGQNAPPEKLGQAALGNVELRSPYSGQKVLVYSPWLDFEGDLGSYNFRDKWERIDHFFFCGDLNVSDFGPQTGEWSYEDGRPKPFKIYSLKGWSDHLPIACRVEY